MSPNSQTKSLLGLQKRALRLICKPYQSHLIKKPSPAHSSLTKLRSFHSPLFPHTSPASVLTTSRISSALTASFPTSSSCKSTRYQYKIPSSPHYNRFNHQLINTFNALPITLRCSMYSTF